MLPRARRVGTAAFPIILRQGSVWHSPILSLRVWFSSNNNIRRLKTTFPARFSVIVSHKVSTKAVERNLWKRRSRAIISKFKDQIKNNYYCLLYLKPTIKTLSFKQLSDSIKDIFNRAKLFTTNPQL